MTRRVLLFIVYLAVALFLFLVQGEIIGGIAAVRSRGWAIVPFLLTMLGWVAYLSRAFQRMGRPQSLAWAALLPLANIVVIVIGLWWVAGYRLNNPQGKRAPVDNGMKLRGVQWVTLILWGAAIYNLIVGAIALFRGGDWVFRFIVALVLYFISFAIWRYARPME